MRRVLQSRFLRSFGKYSFAIYLTHTVVRSGMLEFVIGPYSEGDAPLVTFQQLSSPWVGQAVYYLLATTVAWCIGWLSWQLLEKRFLSLKRYFPY
ncbi:hypothetical protein [Aeoliella sp.]|uniref:hypothetical protein n=1 Tax=Aeoliella sp. TaxID=2795800 RepID=UPI003CCBA791